MIDLRVAHTADLEAGERAGARALLYDVFDDMTEADGEHALGGVHALAREGDVRAWCDGELLVTRRPPRSAAPGGRPGPPKIRATETGRRE